MTRDMVREALEPQIGHLRERFGVERLQLFGSVARNEATEGSDVDLLVKFEGPHNYRQFLDLADYLESVLECKVDLVTEGALKVRTQAIIAKEAIRVA